MAMKQDLKAEKNVLRRICCLIESKCVRVEMIASRRTCTSSWNAKPDVMRENGALRQP